MQREIPQKVDAQINPIASTLLRRTRFSTVVGLALSLGVSGAITAQPKANAAIAMPQMNYLGTLAPLSQRPIAPSPKIVLPEAEILEQTTAGTELAITSTIASPSNSLISSNAAIAPSHSPFTPSSDPLAALETATGLETTASGLETTAAGYDVLPNGSLELPIQSLTSTPITFGTEQIGLAQQSSLVTSAMPSRLNKAKVKDQAQSLTRDAHPEIEHQARVLTDYPSEQTNEVNSQPGVAPNTAYTPIARRAVFPQVPSLELPPLSNVEDYLPSEWTAGQKYMWPAKGVLTSGYGWRWGRMHRGIDIAAPVGTTVVASAPGVVVTAGWNSGGYGNLVEVRHPDGSLTVYAHNNRITSRVGQQVGQGEKIAEMGSTGRSTGPHTHFELHPVGKGAVNPLSYLVSQR